MANKEIPLPCVATGRADRDTTGFAEKGLKGVEQDHGISPPLEALLNSIRAKAAELEGKNQTIGHWKTFETERSSTRSKSPQKQHAGA